MKLFITGYGCITDFGLNPLEFMENIKILSKEKRCNYGILPTTIKEYSFYDRKILEQFYKIDISCQYLLEAVRQILEQDFLFPDDYKIGVIVGSSTGPINIQKNFLHLLRKTGKASSILFQVTANNILSGIIACIHKFTGFNTTIYNGMTSSLDALSLASALIKNEQLDAVLVAGVETVIIQNTSSNSIISNFNVGAAALMLESSKKAKMRNVKAIGEVTQCKQAHFYNDKELEYYLKKNLAVNKSLKYIYINNENEHIEKCIKLLQDQSFLLKIVNIETYTGSFGAIIGLLQVILALQHNSKALIINTDKNKLSNLILEGGYYV